MCTFVFHSAQAREAFPEQTIPPYHWLSEAALYLADAGVLELEITARPFTRGQVSDAILNASGRPTGSVPYVQSLLARLREELAPELTNRQTGSEETWSWMLGSYSNGDLLTGNDRSPREEGFFVSKLGVRPWPGFSANTSMRLDSYLLEDTTYHGTSWNGVTGYSEQAYVTFRVKRLSGWIGRNWLNWGPGRSGNLLISDASRPFSGLHVDLDFSPFTYRWLAAQLNRMDGRNRFLSAHRLEARLSSRLTLALSEQLIYAGENQTWELRLINPAAVWQIEQYSNDVDGNSLFSLDVTWKPRQRLTVGFQFLVDDIQFEKKKPSDLEPNEIGSMGTVIWSDPFGLSGSRWTLETAFVTQRTYNTPHPGEKSLHYNVPIGWKGGNDVINWYARWDHVFSATSRLALDASLHTKGEGRISAPFDTTFLASTVEEGYDEPFPTGTVERTLTLGMEGKYQPRRWISSELRLEWFNIRSKDNIPGEDEEGWRALLRTIVIIDLSGKAGY